MEIFYIIASNRKWHPSDLGFLDLGFCLKWPSSSHGPICCFLVENLNLKYHLNHAPTNTLKRQAITMKIKIYLCFPGPSRPLLTTLAIPLLDDPVYKLGECRSCRRYCKIERAILKRTKEYSALFDNRCCKFGGYILTVIVYAM